MTLSPARLREALTGVIGFPITPFRTDLSVDIEALRQNVRAMLEHPLAAIVAAGGTGELYSLTPREHLHVVSLVIEEARGKLPVIAGIGRQRQTTVFVSRGVGTVYVPMRINCPPDIAILTLRSELRS